MATFKNADGKPILLKMVKVHLKIQGIPFHLCQVLYLHQICMDNQKLLELLLNSYHL